MKVITIGRGYDNDVVINDTKISKNHVQLVQHDNGSYSVIDLNSTNGTYINDKRVTGEVSVHPDDVITIGETRMVVKSVFAKGAGVEATVSITPKPKDSPMETPKTSNKSGSTKNNQQSRKKKKSSKIIFISIIAVLLIIICGISVYIAYDNYTEKIENQKVIKEISDKEFLNKIDNEIQVKKERKKREEEIQKVKTSAEIERKKVEKEKADLHNKMQISDSLKNSAIESAENAKKEAGIAIKKIRQEKDSLERERQRAIEAQKAAIEKANKAMEETNKIREEQEKLLTQMYEMKIKKLNKEQKLELAKKLKLEIDDENEIDKKINKEFKKGDIKYKNDIISSINIVASSKTTSK